jgi:hypothetical protein
MLPSASTAARAAACGLAATIGLTSVMTGTAQAALVGTESALHRLDAPQARQQIDVLLRREDVRTQFIKWGVDPTEAAARVETLGDQEVVTLASRLDETRAGQDAVGAVVGAAVIVIIILVFTDIAGMTDVFTFINKQ